MLFLGEPQDNLESLLIRVNQCGEELLTALPQPDHVVSLQPKQRLFTSGSRQFFYQVQYGILYAEIDERVAYVLQPGDIAGLGSEAGDLGTDYFSDDAVSLAAYDRQSLKAFLSKNESINLMWQDYLISLITLFSNAFGHIVKDRLRPQAGFVRFKPGDVIIQEGDEAENVYTMMKGHARVEVADIEVGVVKEGEIFGSIAALTRSPRNATVIAEDHCTVMAVPSDQFTGLIQAHPETCLHLMESMARTINDLNSRLAARAG